MKAEIHKSQERGKNELGWLHSRFSFSFANYYNPKRIGFGKLVVLNDDIILPSRGFSFHPHTNMEIITIVTEGELEHQDNIGSKDRIKPGELQVMSAGRGIIHSEYNPSENELLKLFQIWIETKKKDIAPRYEKKSINIIKDKLNLIVSGNSKDKVLCINQDAKLFLGKFEQSKEINYKIPKGKGVFIFIIEGRAIVNEKKLLRRDAIALSEVSIIPIRVEKDTYILLIEVPK